MKVRTIDFLRPVGTPRLGWLLLAAGVLAVGSAIRLEQRFEAAQMLRDQVNAEREHGDELARQRDKLAARPSAESRRLAGAAAETTRPWLPALQAVEAATLPPVYVLDFTVDPSKGRVHIEGDSPDFDQAVDYVQRLAQGGGIVQPRLVSHDQVSDPATGRSVVKFTVEAAWALAP